MTDLDKLPWCDCATKYGSREVTYYCRQKDGFRCKKPGSLAFAMATGTHIVELKHALSKSQAELEQLRAECERLNTVVQSEIAARSEAATRAITAETECEQLRRDAERYLKLRHLLIDANGVLHTALNFKGFIEIGEREIDAALDAASAEGEQ